VSVAARSAPRRGRIATWFGSNPAVASPPPIPLEIEGDTRKLVERQLYADVGDFLFTHRLAPTPVNYEVVHAYLTGSDPAVVRAIAPMLASCEPLELGHLVEMMGGTRCGEAGAGALAALATQLESRLAECLTAADRTRSSARDYGTALDLAQAQLDDDPAGTLQHIAGLTREVVSTTRLVETELKKTRREAERLRNDLEQARDAAERDHLTGLPNRRGFERRIEAALAHAGPDAAPRARAIVALCDIDDFKRVNDVHGHPAGDRVLKFVGSYLSEQLGDAACVARHGGEEFAVLIEGRSSYEAMTMLDEARETLAARSLVNHETGVPIGRITFSAGLALLGHDVADALAAADAALYRAKHNGKNGVMMAPNASPS